MNITVTQKASDLHLATGESPILRIDGQLRRLALPKLTAKEVEDYLQTSMTQSQQDVYQRELELDYAIDMADVSRFRVHAFHQCKGPSAAFRPISLTVPDFDALSLPACLKAQLDMWQSGLVLVTGPTGSGKSTTLASMLGLLNQTRAAHIITLEDPIEYKHVSKQCLIQQREMGQHSHSFHTALRAALREDPDILLVGELRDPETIALALTAAETGHLVFATLHTKSAIQTIHRIIDAAPLHDKTMIRSMLAESLQAVIAQTLIPKLDGGRVAALEIMVCLPAIRHLIREDKIAQMQHIIQSNQPQGMLPLTTHLNMLAAQGLISRMETRVETLA